MGEEQETDEAFGDLNALMSILRGLDERGLVLALAAFAEDSLGQLLEAFLLPNSSTKDLLEGFNAPLGTLSSRIKSSYALGLITDEQFADLDLLRKIRNDFSHTWKPICFSDDKIAARIRQLSYSTLDDEFPENPKDKLRSSIGSLLVELQVTAAQISKMGRRVRVVGNRLIAGLSGSWDEQLSKAEDAIRDLEIQIQQTEGEQKAFNLMLKRRWADRLLVCSRAAPAEKRDGFEELRRTLVFS